MTAAPRLPLAFFLFALQAGAVPDEACGGPGACEADTGTELASLLQARQHKADLAQAPQLGYCCYVEGKPEPHSDAEAENGCNPYGHFPCGLSADRCLNECGGVRFYEGSSTSPSGRAWPAPPTPPAPVPGTCCFELAPFVGRCVPAGWAPCGLSEEQCLQECNGLKFYPVTQTTTPAPPTHANPGYCCYVADKPEPHSDAEAQNGCNPYGFEWCGQSEQQCLQQCGGVRFYPGQASQTGSCCVRLSGTERRGTSYCFSDGMDPCGLSEEQCLIQCQGTHFTPSDPASSTPPPSTTPVPPGPASPGHCCYISMYAEACFGPGDNPAGWCGLSESICREVCGGAAFYPYYSTAPPPVTGTPTLPPPVTGPPTLPPVTGTPTPPPPVSGTAGYCCYVADKPEPHSDAEAQNGCNPYGFEWCGQSEQQCLQQCRGLKFFPSSPPRSSAPPRHVPEPPADATPGHCCYAADTPQPHDDTEAQLGCNPYGMDPCGRSEEQCLQVCDGVRFYPGGSQ